MNIKFRYIALSLFVVLVFYLGYLAINNLNLKPSDKPIKSLKQFSADLISPEGKSFSSKQLDGEFYMVNFFASWCGHCIDELQEINQIKDKLPVKYIGVVVADSKENIDLLFQHIRNPFDIMIHNNQEVAANFGNYSLPQNFIVNNKGEIIFKHTGVISKEQFLENIIPFLQEQVK